MNPNQRNRLTVGLLLVLLGAAFLFVQLYPGVVERLQIQMGWPMIIVGVGAFLLILGLLTGAPETAIGACVVAGIGGILYYQNATNDWTSWSYAWALIPGFGGVGMVVAGLLGSQRPRIIRHGLGQILTSLILFLIFASIFSPLFGGFAWLGVYWPLLLIVAGILIIVRGFFR